MIQRIVVLCFFWFVSPGMMSGQHTGVPSAEYADSLFVTGNHEQALIAYQRLAEAEPDSYLFRFRKGLLLGWTGAFEQAETVLKSLYDENPGDLDVTIALIRVISWQNRFSEARTRTETYLQLHPDNQELRLLRLQLVFWQGNLRKATALARELSDVIPEDELVQQVLRSSRAFMRTSTQTIYAFLWDAERTQVHNLSQTVQAGIAPGTLALGRMDYTHALNTFTDSDAQSVRVSLGGSHQFDRSWTAMGSVAAVYVPDNAITIHPTLTALYRTGSMAYALTGTRFLLTDTPALIQNGIYLSEAEFTANHTSRQHEATVRFSHGWLSDDNRRVEFAGAYVYHLFWDDVVYSPGLRMQYRSFELPGFLSGYFAPEWQVWASLRQSLQWNLLPDVLYTKATFDIGSQQFKVHGDGANSPSLNYEGQLSLGMIPVDGVFTEFSYAYTNVAGISSQNTVDSYWAQVLRITVRIDF